MFFLRLGMTNAWRNVARSTLAILSMALAAAFLTNAISLSRGYPGLYKADYRAVLGGEIAVYDFSFDVDIPEGDSQWTYQRSGLHPFSDLDVFYPELSLQGYLSRQQERLPFDEDTVAALAAQDGVRAVYPRYQLPAETVRAGAEADASRRTPLRGRDLQLDSQLARPPQALLREGRWFDEGDEGQLVAVLSYYQNRTYDFPLSGIGSTIRVQVPHLRVAAGQVICDYSDPLCLEFELIGIVEATTRSVEVDESGRLFDLHWKLDEIQIPLSTWQLIWDQAADGPYQPRQLLLQTEAMSYLEDQMLELKQRFPAYSFLSVADIAARAEKQLLIENVELLPKETIYRLYEMRGDLQQQALPMDMRLPLSLLIFLNAALVVAANLLIMMNERTVEIGILKAVGAQRRQIALMALAEALLIAGLGSLSGFAFVRVPAMFNQLTNRTPLPLVLSSIGSDGLLVLCIAALASLLFGLMPALRMANLSVNEVLNRD